MKIKGKIVEHQSIAKKLTEQKADESLRAKIRNLLEMTACQKTRAAYLADERIKKLKTSYALKPKITWELVKVEAKDETSEVQQGAKENLPSFKERTMH